MWLKMSMIKKLARDALNEMWDNVTTPQNYVEGGCSFCKLVKENCSVCLLPKYFCEKEDGKLKKNTLISKIRYAREYLLEAHIKMLGNTDKRFLSWMIFNNCLKLIKRGVRDMMIYGKVRKKTEKKILKFLE